MRWDIVQTFNAYILRRFSYFGMDYANFKCRIVEGCYPNKYFNVGFQVHKLQFFLIWQNNKSSQELCNFNSNIVFLNIFQHYSSYLAHTKIPYRIKFITWVNFGLNTWYWRYMIRMPAAMSSNALSNSRLNLHIVMYPWNNWKMQKNTNVCLKQLNSFYKEWMTAWNVFSWFKYKSRGEFIVNE